MKREKLIVSISGVRGVVGKSLTPERVLRFGASFGTLLGGGKVVVGQDTRTSGKIFCLNLLSGLLSTGCEPIEAGILPTPSLQFLVKKVRARGGVMVTASHNPGEWNGLKFIDEEGIFLPPQKMEKLYQIYTRKKIRWVEWKKIKNPQVFSPGIKPHLERVLELVKVEKIRKEKFKVVADLNQGATCTLVPLLLRRLGCEFSLLGGTPGGRFSRSPEPSPENLKKLSQEVRRKKAEVGFAYDADGDRLALVDEGGNILPPDFTLILCTKHILSRKKGVVVTNISTSHALEEVASSFGCGVERTPIGDVWVSRRMRVLHAPIGGEGSGGVIYPEVNYARDGIIATALILEFLASSRKTLSELARTIPLYYNFQIKIPFSREDFSSLRERILKEFEGKEFIFIDGIKVLSPEGWVLVRPSGTEPVLRVTAESKDKNFAQKLVTRVRKLLENNLQERGLKDEGNCRKRLRRDEQKGSKTCSRKGKKETRPCSGTSYGKYSPGNVPRAYPDV